MVRMPYQCAVVTIYITLARTRLCIIWWLAKMRKLNKDDLKAWQTHLAWEYHEKEWNRLTLKQQKDLMEEKLPTEIDREPYKT